MCVGVGRSGDRDLESASRAGSIEDVVLSVRDEMILRLIDARPDPAWLRHLAARHPAYRLAHADRVRAVQLLSNLVSSAPLESGRARRPEAIGGRSR